MLTAKQCNSISGIDSEQYRNIGVEPWLGTGGGAGTKLVSTIGVPTSSECQKWNETFNFPIHWQTY